jgi:hypothetical protein
MAFIPAVAVRVAAAMVIGWATPPKYFVYTVDSNCTLGTAVSHAVGTSSSQILAVKR